jgi:7,8-dihydropterin-6-yl-methyl-4-(beta-D-ribofuranosyl)aminobenzene 5'-phosphate synthase
MIMSEALILKEAASVSITTLVDNYIDNLLPTTDRIRRPSLMKGSVRREPLLAEHGLSFFIELNAPDARHVIVMDFGISAVAMPHNLAALGLNVAEAESFFISHGHHDHVGAVRPILSSLPKPVNVVVHAEAFLDNRIHLFPDQSEIPIPTLKRQAIAECDCPIQAISSPTLLADGYVLTLTSIPRRTDFEKGMPTAHYRKDGRVFKDDIPDDQALAINVKGKGLVVITGCGHAGIVNTILYAQELTGIDRIYAAIGGYHLTGREFERIIPVTVNEMRRFGAEVLAPCHCTGWKAMHEFEKAFPENFILNSVGATILL